MGRQPVASGVSDSQLGPVSTFSVQAGKAKIVLSVLKNHASIRVRIRSVTPDLTEVGGTLEEAKALRQEHDELTLKLDEKQAEIIALLVRLEGKDADDATRQKIEQQVKDAWKDVSAQLEKRKALLDQSVAFHSSAIQFGKTMSHVEARCVEVPQAQDVDTARRLIQQHQELKKSVLEASMTTLQEGQLLLDRIRQMALCSDVQNRHATTSGCYYIEQLLLNLQDRKRRLEELWLQRKFQLEQCIQLLLLDQDAGKVTKWLDEVGEVFVAKKELGDSLDSANNLLNDCLTVEQQFVAAPPTVRRLIGAVDYLTHPVASEKDGFRQRFAALEQRCESFFSRLNVRRKNVSLSAYFFALAQETSLRLEEIEILVTRTDPGTDINTLAERHAKISQSIVEATIAALHVGRTLLGRVGKDDPAAAGVNAKVNELQERITKLQGLCTARPEPEKQPSESITQLLDRFIKLNAWVKFVGQPSIDRYSDLGIGISDANDFLITHRGLTEDFKAKQTEAKAVLSSAEELAKSGDQSATDVVEKTKKLVEQLEKLVLSAEKRSRIALAYIVLNKREQQLSIQLRLLEDHLKQEKLDPSLIPEAAIRQREDAFKKVTADCTEIDRIGKQFLNDINELKTTDSLNTEFVVRGVSLMLSNFADRKLIVADYFEHWKAYAVEGRTFSTQWKQFVQEARKSIDWIMKTEENFFPKIAGELGSSLNEVHQHSKRLEDFKPTIKKAQEEIEKHLKTAELLSLKGDTRGQRDQVVNELLKVHTRFQARVGEYRYLLNMATKFFENLQELDKLIATTEKEYASEELPKEVSVAEESLRRHNEDKGKLRQLIDFSSEEADQIVIRVRQQDSEEVAKDEVQKVLQLTEEKRRLWEKAWDDHKKRLEQCLQVSQFYFDLKQLQDELDEILRQLDARQGSYGNSLASVKMIIQAFIQLEKLADLIGERFKDFVGTADKMIQDRHYDSRRIRHEVDETEKRWNTVYNTIKSYRIALEASTKFFETMNECEGWIGDAGLFLHGISKQAPHCKSSGDVDKLIAQIQKYKTDGAAVQDGRLNNMERIATDLYGSVLGPEKMQHILDKNQEMFNAFIKAIEDLMILRNNLINTEQILANVGAVVEKKAPRQPRFVQPLQNAEITEGQRFTFECRLECDTTAPIIQWYKDNEPIKGFVPTFKDGICRLTIEETLLRDSGSFACKVSTDAGNAETSATLRVKDLQQKVVAPEFTKQLKPLEVPEGTSCLLECYVSGIPFPTITWFKDDAPIVNSPEHLITIDGGFCYLKIRKLNKGHTGLYKCKATNPGGEAVSSASVNVISVKKPEFTQPLKDAKIDEGKGILLECRYTGDPAPQIQWLYNDSPILPSAIFKIVVEENYTSLEIRQVYPEDCGNYTATAKNLGGEARTTCLLSLHGVLPSVSVEVGKRPEFVQQLHRQFIQEGCRVKLECVVTGLPEPEVQWYHNERPVKKSKDFDIQYQNGHCSLAINEVYLEDSGEYLCTARNVHGMARTECRLIVESLSELSDTGASLTGEVPPKFTQLLKDIEGVEGELVRFECRVIGHPTPTIKWYCGRNQLSSSPEFEIVSERELQTLTIPTVHKDDAGNYMIKATNNAGIAKCYATLIVKPGGDKHAMKMRLIESSHSVQTSFIEGHKPPEVVKAFHDLHVRPGQPCTMEVVITGLPKPKVTWLFNNEPIVSPDYKISALGDVYSLHIPEVFDEDAGRFSVIAENDAGKAWCSALLVVVDMSQLLPDEGSPPETPVVAPGYIGHGPPPVVPKIVSQQYQAPPAVAPQFPESLRNVTAEEGFKATFEIPVSGRPVPVVRWYKDGQQLIAGTSGLEISYRDGKALLSVPNVHEKDAGRYTCTATNAAGEASSTADLIVRASSAKPQFIHKLETQNIREGESVRFIVRVSGKPSPEVKWYREGVLIINSPDFTITHEGDVHMLYIPEVFREDAGKYTVKVFSPAGETESSADLVVEETKLTYTTEKSFDLHRQAPQFVRPLSNRTAQVGQRVTLECAIPPYPAPEKVQWFHNEIEIFISPQHQISYANGTCLLLINKVAPESRGKYACTVRVNGLSSTSDMNLDVVGEPEKQTEIPQFRDKLRHIKYDEGQEVVFICQVAGHPPPNIQWFHNGRLIRPSKKYEMKLTKDGVCSLRIKVVGPDDVGIYTCSASNIVGQEYSSAELYIADAKVVDETSYVSAEALRRMTHSPGRGLRDREIGGVSEQFFKPVFRKVPNDLEVPEGSMARFDSIVAGRPIPDMLWYRDGTQVFDDRLHKIVINEEGINSLIIDATSVSDAGLYTCIARNRAGEDSFQVRLNILPRQAAAPPRFLARLNNQTVNEGQSVTFTVDVEGIPPPLISWQKDGYHITSSDRYQIKTEAYRSTLHIPIVSPEDNAWFQCTAASGSAVATNRVRLIVQAEPQVQISQRTFVQSVSPAPRRITTPVAPSTVNVVIAPSPGPRASPWQQQQQYAEEIMSRTALEMQTKRTEFPSSSEAAPQLIEPMKDQQVMEGVSAFFKCKIYSATEPRHEWFFNNRPIHQSPKYHFTADNGVYTLTIASIAPEDAGIYKCVVSNQGGEVTCIAHLRVGSQLTRLTPVEHLGTVYQAAPNFVKPLSDIRATIGGSVNFDVSISSQAPAEIQWLLNGRPIQPSDNFQVLRSNGTYTLRIKQVTPNDIGTYTCRVISQLGTVDSSARLTIQDARPAGEPPRFTKLLQDANVLDGSEVTLRCAVTGHPKPTVSWFHNGKNIDKSTDFAISFDDHTGAAELVIVDCMRDDRGHFKCVATNEFGQVETGCHLIVTPQKHPAGDDATDSKPLVPVREQPVVPEIAPAKKASPIPAVAPVESPPEDTVVESSAAALQVGPGAVISAPEPVKEEVVQPKLAEPKRISIPDMSSLGQKSTQVTSVVQVEPAGVGHKITEVKGVTTVVEVSQGDAPRFTRPIQPCVVVEGQSCTFSAVVAGDPWPEITWLKEKEDLVLTPRHKTSADATTGNCSLTIVNCQPSDTGVYSCRASNVAGRATCTANVVVVPPNVEVTVTEKTMSVKKEKVTTMGDQEIRVVENSPTFKEALPPLMEVNEGEPVRLQCQITAEPEPNVSWFFNGNRVTSTHRVTVTFDKTLTVLAIPSTTLADTGEYICTAKNPLGEAHTKTFLRVKRLDKEPVPVVPAPQPSSQTTTEVLRQPISSGSAVEVSLPIPTVALTEPCSVIPLSSPKPESPRFSVPLRNQTVREGDFVKFNVQFSGNPNPQISWYINGKPVQEDGDFHVVVDADRGESTLTIREVFSEDEGEYICKAVNSVGTAISNSHLFVVVSSDEERRSTEKTTEEEDILIVNREIWKKNIQNQRETIIIDQKPRTQVIEVLLDSTHQRSVRDETNLQNHFIPIPVKEQRERERSIHLERSTHEQHQRTEVIGGEQQIFSETVAIDTSDHHPQVVEFDLKPEKKTKLSELVVHRQSLPKGMKMEQLLLLERNVKKHEISEALLAPQVFSETVAIDTSDHKQHTLEFELKQLKSSELLVHQQALPKGMRMEAEILESLKKTSRLDLSRSKYIEAIENQRQELLLNLEGAAPKFVKEIESQELRDGDKMRFDARVIGNPMPEEVSWFHDGKLIADNPDFVMEYDKKTGYTTLSVAELFPQDAGTYTCLARNVYGQATTQAYLNVEAYEYVPDSEYSPYTSQAESNISTSSAKETLQKLRIETQEISTKQKQEFEIERIAEKRDEEFVHIIDVKWCKHAEPVVELVKFEGTAEMSVESRAITADQTAIPKITTNISVHANKESLVQPLQERTTVEETLEFDVTDSGENKLKETDTVTSPLAAPAVGTKKESRVHPLHERTTVEETLTFDFTDSGEKRLKETDTVTSPLAAPAVGRKKESRVHPLHERTTVEETLEFDVTDSGENKLKETDTVTSPLAAPAVGKKTEARVSVQMERFHEERLTGGEIGIATPEIPISLAISGLELVRLAKTVGTVFVKPGQLPAQPVETTNTISEVSMESGKTEYIRSELDTARAKDIPSSWVVTIKSEQAADSIEVLRDEVPSPQVTKQEEILGVFVKSVASKEQSHATQIAETHSEGEEEELFCEALEPSLRGKEVVAENLVNVAIRQRPYTLAKSQVSLRQPEVIGAILGALQKETLRQEEVRASFEVASKRQQIPSLAKLVLECININILRIEESDLKEIQKMQTLPQIVSAEFEKLQKTQKPFSQVFVTEERTSPERILDGDNKLFEAPSMSSRPETVIAELERSKREDKPMNRVSVIESRLSPDKTIVVQPTNYDDFAMVLQAPELIKVELGNSQRENKPITRVQTREDQQNLESTVDRAVSRVEDLAMVLSTPELVRTEFVISSKDGKPVTRTKTIEDRLSPDRITVSQGTNLDDVALTLPAGEMISVELVSSTKNDKPVTRIQIQEDRSSAVLNVGELKTQEVSKEFCQGSVTASTLNQAEASGAKPSFIRVQEERMNLVGADFFNGEITQDHTRPEFISSELSRTSTQPRPFSLVRVLHESASPEIIDSQGQFKELSVIVTMPELVTVELVSSTKEEKPVNRTTIIEDQSLLEKTIVAKSVNLDDISVVLPSPELIASEFGKSQVENKLVTRVQTAEERLAFESMPENLRRADDLVTVMPELITSELAVSVAEEKPVTRAQTVEDRISPDRITVGQTINLYDLALTAAAGHVSETRLSTSTKEDKPVLRTIVCEDIYSTEDVVDAKKINLAGMVMILPAAEVESTELSPASKEDKPVTQVLIQEERSSAEKVNERQAARTDEIAMTTSGSQVAAVELERSVKAGRPVSKVAPIEDRLSPEKVIDYASKGVSDVAFTTSPRVQPSVELESQVSDYKPVTMTQMIEERNDAEKVVEKSMALTQLMITAFSSLMVGTELASAIRDFLLTQVQTIEEIMSSEKVTEKCVSVHELLVNALSSQISSAELAFAGREKLILQARLAEERMSPERVVETARSTKDLLVSALSSQTGSPDLVHALRDKLISQVRLMEQRMSPERIYEKTSNTSDLLTNVSASQISESELASAKRDKLISLTRLIEDRISPERIYEKSSSTAELLVNALSSQTSSAEFAYAMRENLISQSKLVEERKSPERIEERGSSTAELLVNALSSQISAAELAYAFRESLIAQASVIEERQMPERIEEKTSSTVELLVNALSSHISAAEFSSALRERLITQVGIIEESTAPERVSERTSSTNELVVNAMPSQIPYVEMTPVTRNIVLTLVQASEERKSPEKITETTALNTAGIAMTVPFAEQVRSELSWGMAADRELMLVRTVEERTSPERISDGISDRTTEFFGSYSEVSAPSSPTPYVQKNRSQTLVLPQVIKLHVEAIGKLDSPKDDRPFTLMTESVCTGNKAAVNECSVYMNQAIEEEKEVITEITITTKKEPETERNEFGEEIVWTKTPQRQEITKETEIETEMITEEWEVVDREKWTESKEDLSETGSWEENWDESINIKTTDETDLGTRREKEPEKLTESSSMFEEWEETITTKTTMEKDVVEEKKKPESISSTESMFEEWDETLTTQTTTETDVFEQAKVPEKEDLSETESWLEEWDETIRTTTFTERDLIVKEEVKQEPKKEEELSETQSLNEEWSETVKTETTTETDTYVEKPETDRESLSETESMHEEWEITKTTTTITEKDIIIGEMERTKVDVKGLLVCKEIVQGKETEENRIEGVDVTDSQLERTGFTGEKHVVTETTYSEGVAQDRMEFRTNLPLVLPFIESQLQPITVIDGSKATLSCKIGGYPVPEVKWYVDGLEIKQSSDFKMTYENGYFILVINDVLPEDEGEYSVRAANAVGTCKSSAFMKVKPSGTVRRKSKDGKPRRSSVEEVCSSGEESSAAWTIEESKVFDEFNNLVVDVSLKRKGVTDSKYEWLEEQSARQKDRAKEGQTEFKQVVVSSQAAQAPVFVTQLESRDVFESTPVKLECDVKGFPQPEISWYQDGKKIQPNDHMKLSYNHGRCTLMIDRVTIEDEAEYVCEARNEHGVATTWAELLVEKLIEGLEQLVMEEFYELEIEMQFKWKPRSDSVEEEGTTA